MNRTVLGVAAGAILLGAAVVAQSSQPGAPTQARVWIQNRGEGEAVPVVLTRGGRVEIAGPVSIDPSTTVGSRAARQAWEYQTLTIPAGADVAVLKTAGAEGWEAVGMLGTTPNVIVLMKRPR